MNAPSRLDCFRTTPLTAQSSWVAYFEVGAYFFFIPSSWYAALALLLLSVFLCEKEQRENTGGKKFIGTDRVQ